MSTTIDQAFVKHFQEEVHQAYQRQGSKLRHTVRTKSGVRGSSTVFQKVGKGTAGEKARHGLVPVMDLDHTPVECSLQDWYAGDWCDQLDELKTNHNERQVIANAGAFALGRKTDELILAGLAETTQTIQHNSTGLTKVKVLEAFETLGDNDVPDDGQRYALVGWRQWSNLLQIEEFASADFIGPENLPWNGTQAKSWLSFKWIPSSVAPLVSTERLCYMFHMTAVGHAIGAEVSTDITWHGDRAAHFISNSMSQGAVLIDAEGVVEIECVDLWDPS